MIVLWLTAGLLVQGGEEPPVPPSVSGGYVQPKAKTAEPVRRILARARSSAVFSVQASAIASPSVLARGTVSACLINENSAQVHGLIYRSASAQSAAHNFQQAACSNAAEARRMRDEADLRDLLQISSL